MMNNKQMNKAVNKYIKEVKSYLICDFKTQRKFTGDLKSRIHEHMDNGVINSADDIYKQIGDPQEIVKGFFENADTRKIKRRMNFTRVLMIGVIVFLLIWGTGIALEVIDDLYHPGYFVEEMYDVDPDTGEMTLESREIIPEEES